MWRKCVKKNKIKKWWVVVLRGNSIVALFSLWVNSILIKFARGPGFDSQLPPIFYKFFVRIAQLVRASVL